MKRVLITGASSGIGRSLAKMLSQKDFELFLVARREEKLIQLQNELNTSKVHIIPCDINKDESYETISKITGSHIDILINNAGLALGRDNVHESKFSDWTQMIDTNITSSFRLVHLVLPWMMKQGMGDIINLCSIAGHYSYQGGAVYCATKHAVKAFTRALREETAGKNIRVMQISPGMVETEFSQVRFKGDEQLANSVYSGMTPLTADDVASMMVFMLERPRHVVIDEIITMPQDQGSPTTIIRRTT